MRSVSLGCLNVTATARLNGLDPEAWLADVLERIGDHPISRLGEFLPWNWRPADRRQAA